MDFSNGRTLLDICERESISISEAMQKRECDMLSVTREEAREKMRHALSVMRESVSAAKSGNTSPLGGYIGGEGRAYLDRIEKRGSGAGMAGRAAAYAMGVIEVNASMGRIVAAPTAGSSGVLPGVLIAAAEEYGYEDDELIDALFNAGAIGYLIARNATVSGAEGGCQAEVGAASAMAASALCELQGGSPEQCLSAAADAISNILGLVCDPICGLVEAPCQKRNAMGVGNAILSAEISLATGYTLVPFDEVVKIMKQVGRALPEALRETAIGGMASAKCIASGGCRACKNQYTRKI